MSRRNQTGKLPGWQPYVHRTQTQLQRNDMDSTDLPPIIARLESEILLQRQRADDAEADLAESRKELANETARADDAERERDRLLAEDVARQDAIEADIEQQYQEHLAEQAAPPVESSALSKEVADFMLAPEPPEATEIARELVKVMAENDRLAEEPGAPFTQDY
jgi:hypothetical protein